MAFAKSSDDRLDASAARRAARQEGRRLVAVIDVLFARLKHLHGLTKPTLRLARAAALLRPLCLLPKKLRVAESRRVLARAKIDLCPQQQRIVIRSLAMAAERPAGLPASADPPGNRKAAIEGLAARLAVLVLLAQEVAEIGGGEPPAVAVDDDGQRVTLAISPASAADAEAAATPSPADAVQPNDNSPGLAEGNGALRLHRPEAPDEGSAAMPQPAAVGLWNQLALRPLRIVLAEAAQPAESAQAAAPRPLVVPGEPSAEAARRILQRHCEQLLSRQYGLAYADDAEYVHEMRVAIRRLRAAIRGFRKSFEGGLEHESRELRRLADALGTVRDADVFLDFLQVYSRKAFRQRRPLLAALLRNEGRQRRSGNRKLLVLCRSAEWQQFLAGFYARLREPFDSVGGLAATPGGAARPVEKHARQALARRLEDVAEFGRRLDELSPGRQHELRIACKKFRYTAEFFAELYPPALNRAVATLTRLQDLLGANHDADVYLERLDRIFARCFGKKHRGRADTVLRLLRAHLKRRKKRDLARAELLWGSFLAPRRRQALETLLALPRRGL